MNRSEKREGYDVALVCENGHEVNAASQGMPEFNAKRCDKCGAKAIDACPTCETSIRGFYWGGAISAAPYKPPAFCHDCGEPYPWTKASLEAAEELIRFNEYLSDEEKGDFLEALKETTRDTPKARVAAEKIKRYGKKLGTETMKRCARS